jgi:hypothetical protein
MKPERENELLVRHRARAVRRQLLLGVGFVLLLAGYGLLAISPDTPSEWVLLRVFAGFGLLFVGFGIAVVPLLGRITGSEDE